MNFESLVSRLDEKHTKEQLGALLAKYKDARISNAICAAYNGKCQQKVGKKTETDVDIYREFFRAKERALGPDSWFFHNLVIEETENPWNLFLEKVTDHNTAKVSFAKLKAEYYIERIKDRK